MAGSIFPHIKKAVEDFMYDQEGNIPRNKVLTIGSMVLILGILLADEAFAAHRSHSSHSSHSSHRSHSSGSGGHSSHSSHVSHTSHTSHTSGDTHSNASHSSAPAHSNAPAHASHSNASPSLSTLNAMKLPSDSDVVDLNAVLEAVGTSSIPPETTSIDLPPMGNPAQTNTTNIPPSESTGD